MPYEICKEFTFDAAHSLPHHEGACKNLHGHTYKVAIHVRQDELQEAGPAQGMVCDFGTIKDAWKKIHADLDHSHLNKVLPNPTAEILKSRHRPIRLIALGRDAEEPVESISGEKALAVAIPPSTNPPTASTPIRPVPPLCPPWPMITLLPP